jgi:hypothetical protein
MLGGEPWCFHVEKIALLTDRQIMKLYIEPAIERAKRDAERPSDSPPTWTPTTYREDEPAPEPYREPSPPRADHPEIGTPAFREWVIGKFMDFGMSRKRAEAKFEEQKGGT